MLAPAMAAAPTPKQSLGPVTSLPLPRFVSLKRSEVNMRRGPSEDQPILWVYKRRNMPLEVVNEFDVWRKVRDVDGAEGWIQATMLAGDPRYGLVRYPGAKAPQGVTGATGKVQGWVLKRRPEKKAATIAIVQAGVVAKVVRCHEAWCEVRAGEKVGWLDRAALWGVYPGEEVR
jgi:SH3-like domain-containing protein